MIGHHSDLQHWLRAIDLSRVAITAEILPDGELKPVGGLWAKTTAGAEHAVVDHHLEVLIVAVGQEGVEDSEIIGTSAFPIRVFKCRSLEDAAKRLYEHHGPRAAAREFERSQCGQFQILGRQVSRAEHYVPLPLFRKLDPKKDLPLQPRPTARGRGDPKRAWDDEERADSGTQPLDEALLRWEEEARHQENKTFVRQRLEDVLAIKSGRAVGEPSGTVPRLVLIGPPGSGKTTLWEHLAWLASDPTTAIAGRPRLPARLRLPAWEAWTIEDGHSGKDLADYLAWLHRGRRPAPTADHWRAWLNRGDVILLMDGLDETRQSADFVRLLTQTLHEFSRCPTVMTCRSLTVDRHREECAGFPVFLLGGLDRAGRDAFIESFPGRRFEAKKLIAELDRLVTMQPLGTNPLLLAILCFVVDDSEQKVELPTTRGELYDRAVMKFLEAHARVRVGWPKGETEPDPDTKRRVLERMSLPLFADGKRNECLTSAEFGQRLKLALEPLYGEDSERWLISFKRDIGENSGIVRGTDSSGFLYLHPTLLEFLAASSLARTVNEEKAGWETVINIHGRTRKVQEFVSSKAWDPLWQEVICMLAGRLHQPGFLLGMLGNAKPTRTNPNGDDAFHHRLALAATCMAEVPRVRRAAISDVVNDLTRRVFRTWWRARRSGMESAFAALTRSLPSLGLVNGYVPADKLPDEWLSPTNVRSSDLRPIPFLHRIARLVRVTNWSVRSAAAERVGDADEALATEPFLARIAELLRDTDGEVRRAAVDAVRGLGPAAATGSFLARIAELLRDTDSEVRWAAAGAVGGLGAAAATESILARVTELLRDTNSSVRYAAAGAVGGLGAAAATEPFLARIAELLRDTRYLMRTVALYAVGGLGAAAATEPFLARIAELLRDTDSSVRYAAAEAVGGLGAAAATEPFLARIAELLRDTDWDLRSKAVQTVRGMGAAAATEPFLARISELLGDTDHGIRTVALEALGGMGAAAATEPFLARISELLGDTDRDIRRAALEALSGMGAAAATEPFLAHIAALLGDPDWLVRDAAARAVGGLGAAAATEPFLARVAELLHDTDPSVRRAAAAAVGGLGKSAATGPILGRIAELLRDTNRFVLFAGVPAVAGLGRSAATEPILARIAELLHDTDDELRNTGAHLGGALGEAGATEPILARFAELLRDGDYRARDVAVEVIGGLGAAAATKPILARLAKLLRDTKLYVRRAAANAIGKLNSDGIRVFDKPWRAIKVSDLSR
jgi:HEAT repeat protein